MQDKNEEIESLRQQLAECQAREAKLREWIQDCLILAPEDPINYTLSFGRENDIALREIIKRAKRDALLEAAEYENQCIDGFEAVTTSSLYRMVEELK